MVRLVVTALFGIMFGFFVGLSFPALSLTKINIPSGIFRNLDLTYIEDRYSGLSTRAFLKALSPAKNDIHIPSPERNTIINDTKVDVMKLHIWVPSNPRGAKRLPPGIVEPESDYSFRRLWGHPNEDLPVKPKYLVTFTVGYNQKNNIDAGVKKFSENFTIVLFHYDGLTEWDEFEWSKRVVHVSARKQTKWWFAKRFLHPDIVAAYDYIFIWDEDLGVENFDGEEYIRLVRKYGLEISQPGLDPSRGLSWAMTARVPESEVHKYAYNERPAWCPDPHMPPCSAFVEIMAPVFSRDAWRCAWHMLQNDLVHGWGLDFALRRCVEPAHEKIGAVDAHWIVHQSVPSLGSQGESDSSKEPWKGVRDRCHKEWTIFEDRMANAERTYFQATGYRSL